MSNSTSNWMWTATNVIYTYVIPVELCVGLCLQLLNLYLLNHQSLRRLSTYTVYLKCLSYTYIVVIPFLLISIGGKLEVYSKGDSYVLSAFSAYLETYIINVLLCYSNFLIVLIALEAAYSLFRPFSIQTRTNAQAWCRASCLLLSSILLLVPLMSGSSLSTAQSQPNSTSTLYSIVKNKAANMVLAKRVLSSVLELWLLILIALIYLIIFIKHRRILRESSSLQKNRHLQNAHKAVLTCSAPVAAFAICNTPSAIKETINLLLFFDLFDSLQVTRVGPIGQLFTAACNASLLFNCILFVLMQSLARKQYKSAFKSELSNFSHGVRHKITRQERTKSGRKRPAHRQFYSHGHYSGQQSSISRTSMHLHKKTSPARCHTNRNRTFYSQDHLQKESRRISFEYPVAAVRPHITFSTQHENFEARPCQSNGSPTGVRSSPNRVRAPMFSLDRVPIWSKRYKTKSSDRTYIQVSADVHQYGSDL